jgi:uncharacterized membrane protein YeaQ/YmgE (transglycosylase-associated protein family)
MGGIFLRSDGGLSMRVSSAQVWACDVPARQRRCPVTAFGHADCRCSAGRILALFNLPRSAPMINFLLWLVAGGVLGWVASVVMLAEGQQGVFMNLMVGIFGAALGGWFLSPMVGLITLNQNDFSVGGLLVAMVGAIVLLSVYNVFRPGPAR